MTRRPQEGFSKVIGLLVVLGVVILGVLAYFFILRTPDTDYTDTIQDVSTMKTSAQKIVSTLNDHKTFATFNATSLGILEGALKQYGVSYDALSSSRLVQRDASLNKKYASDKKALADFRESATTTVAGVSAYVAFLNACSSLPSLTQTLITTQKDTSGRINDYLSGCRSMISGINSSQVSENLKGQFLDSYAHNALDLVNGLTAMVKHKGGGVELDQAVASTNVAIRKISVMKSEVDYRMSTPTEQLDELSTYLTNQKNSLFR